MDDKQSINEMTEEVMLQTAKCKAAEDKIEALRKELKDANNELSRALDTAQKASLAKTEFLGNMSHELKTPMNAILGFANLLNETSLDISQKKYIETIVDRGQHLLALIGDLLDMSQIVSSEVVLKNKPFSIRMILDRIARLSPQLNEHGVQFNCDIDISPELIFTGDHSRITQIILSLLDNAFKFTESGEVRLSAVLKEDIVSSETGKSKCVVEIVVEDSGCGIPPDQIDKIFNSFFQLDYSHTRKYGGLGVGLAVVKRLVEVMEGKVEVNSEVGKGSSFKVELNLTKKEEEDKTKDKIKDKKLPSEYSLSKKLKCFSRNIDLLLVEDNTINALMMCEILVKRGAMIDTATNGAKAVDMVKEKDYDVVLMDVMMPVMGGLEATEKIRKDVSKEIPIIGVSAATLKEDVEKGLGSGMNDYVSKPVDFDTLIDVIENFIVKV